MPAAKIPGLCLLPPCNEPGVLCAAVPGVIILIAGIILPESPSSLAENGHIDQARRVRSRAFFLSISIWELSHVQYIWMYVWTGCCSLCYKPSASSPEPVRRATQATIAYRCCSRSCHGQGITQH